jgi:hypothetical protein
MKPNANSAITYRRLGAPIIPVLGAAVIMVVGTVIDI